MGTIELGGIMVWVPAAIAAAGSIAGGLLSNMGPNESRMQRTQRKLVDKLLSSLNGKGPFADLFTTDESAFQKSFVEPAMSRFRNQIAPQIQQQFIAGGQQRGTGLDDTLTRAGVDLDALLNQYMFQQQEAAKQRATGAISNVFGVQGAPVKNNFGQNLGQATAGYLASPAFSEAIKDFRQTPQTQSNVYMPPPEPTRKGYLPDLQISAPRWSIQ